MSITLYNSFFTPLFCSMYCAFCVLYCTLFKVYCQ
nr:MAG TPA: hypothetical protein [Caudoviricetes sp.]